MLAGGDADGSGRPVAELAQRSELRLDLVEARPDRPQQALAGLGGRDAAGGPRQQPQPEPLLQAADGMAQRRLRHPELRRRPGEAPLARDGEEGEEVADGLARHS